MYARYIPPTKKRDPPPAVVPDYIQEAPPPAAISQNSAIPYARYIPPPKGKAPDPVVAQPRKIVFTDDDFPSPEQKKRKRKEEDGIADEEKKEKKLKKSTTAAEELDEPHDSKKSQKEKLKDSSNPEETLKKSKAKKEKKRRKQEAEEADAEADNGIPPATADGDSKKEQRDREKKKKKTKEQASEDQSTDSLEQSQKKYKTVFERKEKALKREPAAESNAGSKDPDLTTPDDLNDGTKEVEETHGLEPLPQPEPVNLDGLKASYETLPPWLAAPIRVTPSTVASFTGLGIGPEASKILEAKGYKEAFAVQTAAIPLLLPSPDRQGDLVISAATGSGKTLAYVLPMVHDISQGVVTKLRALVVVPTRELVRQAQEACEVCAGAFAGGGRKRVKIGISMGSQALRQEQSTLIEEEQIYDPEGYEKQRMAQKVFDVNDSDDDDDIRPLLSTTKPLPGHVIEHASKVDILICTPGRLVEHINQTPGFTLNYVRWLVVDEADKLLAQSFQQWLDIVMEKLSIKGQRDFRGSNKSGVRKIILSATMTRDLSLLNSLKLRRPKLIVLEGQKGEEDQTLGVEGEHVLPDLLQESVIKIRNPNLKPLYLVDLLNSKHMVAMDTETNGVPEPTAEEETGQSSTSDSSDSESDSGSESPADAGSDASSDSDSDSGSDSSASSSSAAPAPSESSPFSATVLIFTKSNESALRLSRLLALLSPRFAPLLGTLTSTTRTAERRRTLRAFTSGRTRVLVASDLVARGIDLPGLDHVVNYDVPTGPASYVHRVGRTARAGRKGRAWTFVTKAEAGWFWREVGGEGKGDAGRAVRRARKVERVRVGGDEDDKGWFSEERVKTYEDALEQLGKEAGEMRKRK